MKGFEVKFRDETVRIAVDEPIVVSIITEKVRGKLNLRVGGWIIDTDTHSVWVTADDLKQDDEIIIERKEVAHSSKPLLPPADFDPNQPLTSEEEQVMWQYKLQYYRKLENVLQKEGLINKE